MKCIPLLPVVLAAAIATACGGGGGAQDAVRAAADSATRRADSIARAATTGPQRLANVMIGKRLGTENRIAEPTFQFAPEETVYVSAAVQGAPAEGTLSAHWVDQKGKTLDSTVQTVAAGDAKPKEFHLSQPKGWPAGTYLVTLLLNGDSVDAKTFAVRKAAP